MGCNKHMAKDEECGNAVNKLDLTRGHSPRYFGSLENTSSESNTSTQLETVGKLFIPKINYPKQLSVVMWYILDKNIDGYKKIHKSNLHPSLFLELLSTSVQASYLFQKNLNNRLARFSGISSEICNIIICNYIILLNKKCT